MLSVVIPVYNVCSYLERCVGSVVAFCENSNIDFEVILVDDGSKDGSSDVCDRLSSKDDRISVVHQINQGVSVSRNEGLARANGQWIWFVDSDDYVSSDAICLNLTDDDNFVVTGFVWDENGDVKKYSASSGETPYNLWRCWFRKDLIDGYDLKFTVGRKYAEDQEFILRYLVYAKSQEKYLKTYAITAPLYYYTIREGSAMTKKGVKGKMVNDIFKVLCSFMYLAIKNHLILSSWSLHEMKRLMKTIIVTVKM